MSLWGAWSALYRQLWYYSEFVERRSAGLQAAIRQEAGFKKGEGPIPVVLVENSGRCNTNANGEKILPNRTVWLPNLVEKIVEVATGPTESLLVDKKLIEGPNANQRGNIWIPLLILFQVCTSQRFFLYVFEFWT
ncbi:unnamed protein product [Calypogeia fissa]